MSLGIRDEERRIIPRWRDSATTSALGELSQPGSAPRPILAASDFEQKALAWEREQTPSSAAELVGAALVLGREQDAIAAAQFLVRQEVTVTTTVREVAQTVLLRAGELTPPAVSEDPTWKESARSRIRHLRSRLHDEPRNAVLWTDLSREYASIGLSDQASRAMETAVALVEGNRFVLRSAVRLWVHLHDPERAHDLLRRRVATQEDPWLTAAEIAVASVAERQSRLVKRATQMISNELFDARQTSELASALATLAMKDGSAKTARRLFAHSLVSPTDNSLAQATWAARRFAGISVDPSALALPRTFEARAWQFFGVREWFKSIRQCMLWIRDEPFAKRAAQMGSYMALVGANDPKLAETLVKLGLRAHPSDPALLNNLVVGLIEQGHLDEAERLYHSIRRPVSDQESETTLVATAGLLAFRRGNHDLGRKLYADAIAAAIAADLHRIAVIAELYMIREMIRAGEPGVAATLTEALQNYGKLPDADVQELLGRLRQDHNAKALASMHP
ncbi:MAG TPA: hypothetical protein VNZ26_24945 [Vicinamibacterales bacterium]|nr:hypothetical protein [Vicinamibacterales bacterium]